jgi:hypothetical protein
VTNSVSGQLQLEGKALPGSDSSTAQTGPASPTSPGQAVGPFPSNSAAIAALGHWQHRGQALGVGLGTQPGAASATSSSLLSTSEQWVSPALRKMRVGVGAGAGAGVGSGLGAGGSEGVGDARLGGSSDAVLAAAGSPMSRTKALFAQTRLHSVRQGDASVREGIPFLHCA